MRRIKQLIYGQRVNGETLPLAPTLTTNNSGYIEGYMLWVVEFKFGQHAPNVRTILRGNEIIEVSNIKYTTLG